MTRRSFAALFISTLCCFSMTLTAFGAVTDTPKDSVILCGGEADSERDADPADFGPGVSSQESEQTESGESLGMFTTTGYCNCEKCNSGGHALTYSGTVPKAEHTISADLSLYPIGTRLMIGDIIYTVEDKGTHVSGNWIDVYYDDHDDAWNHGLKTEEVFLVEIPVQNEEQ